jgi:ornithine cyclodeaminase
MPCEVVERVIGLKVISAMADNPAKGHEAHQAVVLLFDENTGTPVAMIEGGVITALRTAAATAVATRELSRPDSSTLAILGTGTQARAHVDAMQLVRSFKAIRVYSRDEGRRRAFAAETERRLGVTVTATNTAEEAVRGADVVCTVTSSKTPVLERAWLSDGVHVNAVGASLRTSREIDTETVRAARVFVDSRESATNEAGELLKAIEEGAVGTDHIAAEIGEVLLGKARGRCSTSEITVFRSLGLAIQDVLAANHAYTAARTKSAGTVVSMA